MTTEPAPKITPSVKTRPVLVLAMVRTLLLRLILLPPLVIPVINWPVLVLESVKPVLRVMRPVKFGLVAAEALMVFTPLLPDRTVMALV